jgi:hypothetical protein
MEVEKATMMKEAASSVAIALPDGLVVSGSTLGAVREGSTDESHSNSGVAAPATGDGQTEGSVSRSTSDHIAIDTYPTPVATMASPQGDMDELELPPMPPMPLMTGRTRTRSFGAALSADRTEQAPKPAPEQPARALSLSSSRPAPAWQLPPVLPPMPPALPPMPAATVDPKPTEAPPVVERAVSAPVAPLATAAVAVVAPAVVAPTPASPVVLSQPSTRLPLSAVLPLLLADDDIDTIHHVDEPPLMMHEPSFDAAPEEPEEPAQPEPEAEQPSAAGDLAMAPAVPQLPPMPVHLQTAPVTELAPAPAGGSVQWKLPSSPSVPAAVAPAVTVSADGKKGSQTARAGARSKTVAGRPPTPKNAAAAATATAPAAATRRKTPAKAAKSPKSAATPKPTTTPRSAVSPSGSKTARGGVMAPTAASRSKSRSRAPSKGASLRK